MNVQELLTYFEIIRKRLWVIGVVVGVTVGAIALSGFLARPQYRSTAQFQVTAPLPNEVSLVNEYRVGTNRDELTFTRNNFLAVLQSEYVAAEVASKLGLNIDPATLADRVTIESDASSDFVSLRVVADDPQQASDIANTLLETASNYFATLSAGSFTANKEVITRQLEDTQAEWQAAKDALVKFQVENKIGSFTGILESPERLLINAQSARDEALATGRTDVAAKYDLIIARHEAALQKRVQLNAEYEILQSNVNRVGETYKILLAKEAEVELKEQEILSARFIRIIPAQVPQSPLNNLDVRMLLVGALASVVVGIVLAFILEGIELSRKAHKPVAKDVPAETAPATPVALQASWEAGKD